MVLRGVALLAVARGVVAQCTVSGVSAPSNGELSADCPSDGSTVADGASMPCYICDYGFTFSGTYQKKTTNQLSSLLHSSAQ